MYLYIDLAGYSNIIRQIYVFIDRFGNLS